MPVTIKDIAQAAGVSRGTVDRALNRREGINPEVAERIRKIAKEMGYIPNRAGRALASRKNPLQIGVILNSVGNPFYADVIRGIQAAKKEFQDFSVKIHMRKLKGYDAEKQLEEIDSLLQLGVNALVLTPIDDNRIREKINQLTADKKPVVKLNSDIENTQKAVYIGCDYRKSGATAAGLMGMFCHGKGTVAIITGSMKMLGHNQRVEEFIRVCKNDFPQMKIAEVAENNDDSDLSFAVTEKLLKGGRIDAFYFAAAGVEGGVAAIDRYCQQNRPLVICCDATEEIRRLIQMGKIQATVCQQPFQQGYESIKTVFNIFMTGNMPEQKEIWMENEIKISYNL